MTTADTRRFTPNEIAITCAKRLARYADFDENWRALIVERGIELAEDGAFTITTEAGQTFHLAVTETARPAPRVFFPGELIPRGTEVQSEGGTVISWSDDDGAVPDYWGPLVTRPFPRGVEAWRALVAGAALLRDGSDVR